MTRQQIQEEEAFHAKIVKIAETYLEGIQHCFTNEVKREKKKKKDQTMDEGYLCILTLYLKEPQTCLTLL